MTLTEKFKFVKSLLEQVAQTHHYWADAGKSNCYIVYSENAETDPVDGDNRKEIQTIPFDVNLYVLDDMDKAIDKMQDTFKSARIDWQYDGVSYEVDTGLIHHMWRIWV